MNTNKLPALWTKDFILVFVSNLLLFFSFYMLIPVLPLYLIEEMDTSGSLAGIVLALYTISALCIRPFSGFLVDMFSRKPLYLICYGAFCITFAGYVVGTTLVLFTILRIFHGLAFGMSTVSGSTVAIDKMTSERRGEGIGYFGMAANIAMAIGPVAGLWIHQNYSYDALFLAAFFSSLIGFFTIVLIKPVNKEPAMPGSKQPMSLDRFILLKAIPCVGLLFIAGLGYGSVLNYMGLYSEMAGYENSAGIFFVVLAMGILLARLLSAKTINKGKIALLIKIGSVFLILSFSLLALCNNTIMLYVTAFLLGIGYGYINPAFQAMLINLAEHNQRGTANATYFTFWDLGIGLGTVIGGIVISKLNFSWLYAISSAILVLGVIYFAVMSAPYFQKNKLR
ncbi:MFS transporter [Dysgonomonas sp. 511]|uniref:MFS transporter n=1 Tax=Dysgonomonas sp. 511 TaxID=2302930 RepID=UPI0013D14093|nr:MFS transporter [Dysgonomonas sp. 511]NDV79569.1 MFS transporter [Dysgonomonas sp. 511]